MKQILPLLIILSLVMVACKNDEPTPKKNSSTSSLSHDGPEYYQAEKISNDNLYCKSFYFNGKEYAFNDPDQDGISFDTIPNIFPEDLGAVYFKSSTIESKSNMTIRNKSESGESRFNIDVTIQSDQVNIREHKKIYIFFSNDCLDSVKVYDYLK